MKYLILMIVLCGAMSAYASGDKNRKASPILAPGDAPCVYMVPPGIELTEDCTELSVDQQGNSIYTCPASDTLIFCVPDSDDDKGKD